MQTIKRALEVGGLFIALAMAGPLEISLVNIESFQYFDQSTVSRMNLTNENL